MTTNIAWFDGAADAAFDTARTRRRPLLLYWGASWCPPCNRTKADLFRQADFVAASGALVPVFLDGDGAGAQQLAARLKLRSYPTLVLYDPDGGEITRLPNEPDGETGAALLRLALASPYSAAQSLAAALGATRTPGAGEWRLLAFYSWDTDEGQLLAGRDLAATLTGLARLCPPGESADRLALHAQVMAAPDAQDAAGAALLLRIAADAASARANMDLLTNHGAALVTALSAPQSALRGELLAALDGAAAGWADDLWLSVPDRAAALRLRVRLARLGLASSDVLPQLAGRIAASLDEAADGFERHSVVNTAAGALTDAGQLDAADTLLRAELPRSHSPFYFMQSLAANARRRGDTAAMLDWYEQAWVGATGYATRIQWGATYLVSLLGAAPADTARVAAAADGMLADVQAAPDAFSQRNRGHLQRLLPLLPGSALGAALKAGLAA